MGIQRATTLYPVNTTTVDTGTGIDIRLLDSAQAAPDDTTQTANFTHTNDNVERTFDPATGGVTNTNNAGTTLFKTGWALRLSQDMTPGDDTNCDAVLLAGTLTVSLQVNATQSGGTYLSGTYGPTFRASLWKYNPSTDTGTLIAAGSTTAITWAVTALNVVKTASISINVASNVVFSQGTTAAEVLLLQVGFNTGTVPNPTLGTANWVQTLIVDNANTNIVFGSGQGVVQFCSLTNSMSANGMLRRNYFITPTNYNLTARGSSTYTKLATVAKNFALSAAATASRTGLLVLALPRDLIGIGSVIYARQVTALRNFNLIGRGEVISYNRSLSIGRIATGIATVAYLKQVTASKSFNLTGAGTPYYSKFTIANRTFNVVGQGRIVMTGPNASMISMPLDDVPDSAAPSNTYIFPVLD